MDMTVVTLARGDELWEITWIGGEVEIASGPRGKEPRVEERVFADPAEAAAFAAAEIEARRADGWVDSEVEHDGGAAEREALRAARPTERAWAMRRREPPPETEPVTRVGGRPLVPRGQHWPDCQQCFHPMQFLAQVRLSDTGDPEVGDGLLLIFHCDESGGMCEPFNPGLGSNLALVCEVSSNMELLPIPKLEPRRSRVLDRVDGVELVPLDRPPPLDPDDYDDYDDCDGDEDPYAALRRAESEAIIGMLATRPDWIQDEQIPSCAACRRPMRPVAQLEDHGGGGINFGDLGCGYAFVCTGCRAGAFLMQCH